MKLLQLYKWIAGGMTDFTRQFQDNENLFKQAQSFWNKLESVSIWIVIICIGLSILLAVIYYQPYNNIAGRHYKPTHWVGFLLLTFIATFGFTWLFEYIAAAPKLQGSLLLEMKIALCNAIYASGLYFVLSFIWCWCLPTNAYRFLKFK